MPGQGSNPTQKSKTLTFSLSMIYGTHTVAFGETETVELDSAQDQLKWYNDARARVEYAHKEYSRNPVAPLNSVPPSQGGAVGARAEQTYEATSAHMDVVKGVNRYTIKTRAHQKFGLVLYPERPGAAKIMEMLGNEFEIKLENVSIVVLSDTKGSKVGEVIFNGA